MFIFLLTIGVVAVIMVLNSVDMNLEDKEGEQYETGRKTKISI